MRRYASLVRFVDFKATDGVVLPGLLFEPKNKSTKVAIFLHGNGHSSIFYDVKQMNVIAEYLINKNISFFPFNNRGAYYLHKLKKVIDNKKEDVKAGTAMELIKECIYDIDGAINFLKQQGYKTFYLIGISTGANKIVVYHYYKPKNPISKYVLLSGGDDTGLSYEMMGKEKFYKMLKKCQSEINKGNGMKLIPSNLDDYLYSYQSLYDTINPDGDYNTFPFNEYINKLRLSTKPLFREYQTIDKPTLVIYGENDEYCYNNVPKCIGALKKECPNKKIFTFKIIKGADHGFSDREKELAETITNWF